jgi:hypothetical protein
VQTGYLVACELLDEEHPALTLVSIHDDNAYTFGRIGDHNIVVACLPQGRYGLISTASVTKNTVRTFPVRFGVMVGIGGAPSWKHGIRRGDVVASSPKNLDRRRGSL